MVDDHERGKTSRAGQLSLVAVQARHTYDLGPHAMARRLV